MDVGYRACVSAFGLAGNNGIIVGAAVAPSGLRRRRGRTLQSAPLLPHILGDQVV